MTKHFLAPMARLFRGRRLIVALVLLLFPLNPAFAELIGARVQLGHYSIPGEVNDYSPPFQSGPQSRSYTGGSTAATAGTGVLSVTGQYSSPANVPGTAYFKLNSYFADTVTIDAPGRTGQRGAFTVSYVFDGTYDANGYWDNSVGISCAFLVEESVADGIIDLNSTSGNGFSYRGDGTYGFGFGSTLFPGEEQTSTHVFTFGQPFDFFLKLSAQLRTFKDVPGDTQVAISLMNWSGIRNITAAGAPVADAEVSSVSNIDWTQAVPPAVNHPPVAAGQSVVTDENTAKTITLAASDVENSPLTFTVVTPPAKGTLTGTAPNLTYTPNAHVNGTDSFTFKANDGTDDSIAATVAITIHAAARLPIVFDPVADFSSGNPSGAWSYGYSATRGAAFMSMTQFSPNDALGLDAWSATEGGPWVVKNKTGADNNYGTVSQPPDMLNLDPSFDGRNAVLRWTAPWTRTYQVKGLFQGLDSTSTDVAVLTGATVAVADTVSGRGDQFPFEFTVNLAAGQTIHFSVGQGSGGSLYDGTGVKATIEQTADQPANTCTIAPPGLISWWRGQLNPWDSINSNHAWAGGGVSYVPGKAGTAFHLDGNDDYLEVPDSSLVRPDRVSVEAWVRLSSLDSVTAAQPGLQYIVFKKNSRAVNFEGFSLVKHRGTGLDRFAFEVTSGAGALVSAATRSAVTANEWYHLVGAYDGSTVKLYVNGIEEDSQPVSFALDYGDRPLFIGSSGESNFDGKFAGEIDEVSLYNRALASAEVTALFIAGSDAKCLPALRQVTGQIVDTANQPVGGVEVAAFGDLREFVSLGFDGALARAFSDATGKYTLTGPSNERPITLVARYDANKDRQDNDNRRFIPASQNLFLVSATNKVAAFLLQLNADTQLPSLRVSNPPSPADDLTSLAQALGTTSDDSDILGVWAALVRTDAAGAEFLDWDSGKFEVTTTDAPQFYSAARVFPNTSLGNDWELAMPRLPAGSYELRVMSVDNARRFARINTNFRIVPVVQTFTTGGDQILPPMPPGANLDLQAANNSSVTVTLPGLTPLATVNIGAAAGSAITAIIPGDAKLVADQLNLLSGATALLPGQLTGNLKNVAGSLAGSLAPIGKITGEAGNAFGAIFKGFFGNSALHATPDGIERGARQLMSYAPSAAAIATTGSMEVEGNYDQGVDGRLIISIGGSSYSETGLQQYDRLDVSGTATLSGTLAFTFVDPEDSVNNPNPFAPAGGSQFDILVAESIVLGNLQLWGPASSAHTYAWGIADLPDGRQALRLVIEPSGVELSIQLNSPTTIEIAYPSNVAGYTLEATTDLGSNVWTPVATTNNRATINLTGSTRFFRLTSVQK